MSYQHSAWLPIETAPKDGTIVRLLVEFEENPTEDVEGPCITIGMNSFDHSGIPDWRLAGWNWQQDCFTEGVGKPIGWLPLIDLKPE